MVQIKIQIFCKNILYEPNSHSLSLRSKDRVDFTLDLMLDEIFLIYLDGLQISFAGNQGFLRDYFSNCLERNVEHAL
jgi:hypothetical protein